MEKNGKIIEINQHVRDALNQWADITLEMEAKQWAYLMDYFPRDLMNATYLFQHVASNIGIKNGHIDEERAKVYGERLRRLIIDMTGYDPKEIGLAPETPANGDDSGGDDNGGGGNGGGGNPGELEG